MKTIYLRYHSHDTRSLFLLTAEEGIKTDLDIVFSKDKDRKRGVKNANPVQKKIAKEMLGLKVKNKKVLRDVVFCNLGIKAIAETPADWRNVVPDITQALEQCIKKELKKKIQFS